MLEKISNGIAFYFVRNNIIGQDDIEVYSFGVLAFLEMSINILSTLILAIIFDCIPEAIGFVLIYIPLRSCAGGYHAKKYISCYIISIALFLLVMFLSFAIPTNSYRIVESISIIFTLSTILLLAPIDSENKRATKEEKKKFRKISILIALAYSMTIMIFMIFSIESRFIVSFSLGGVFCAIFLLISLKERRRSDEK